VQDDLAELEDDRRRGRVHERGEDGHLDDGPVALRNADEARHVGMVEITHGHAEDGGHLLGIRRERSGRFAARPHDDRRDDVTGARAVIVEHAEDGALLERKAELLVQLAQGRGFRRLAGVDAAARQRPLARVGAQPRRAPGEQEARAALVVGHEHEGDRRQPAAVGGDGAALEAEQVRAGARPQRIVEDLAGQ
jgi:hypothetical protein